MALTAADFIAPIGELSEEMFPGQTLTNGSAGIVDVLLAKAVTLTSDEAKQEAYVYCRAFSMLANSTAAALASEREGERSATRDPAWAQRIRGMAERYCAAYSGPAAGPILTAVGYEPSR